MKASAKNTGGFTLVEIMIAMTLTGLLLSALFAVNSSINQLVFTNKQSAQTSKQALYVIETLSKDLNNLINQRWNPAMFFKCERKEIQGKRLDFLSFPSGGLYSNPSTLQSHARSVTWYARTNDATGKTVLYRREDVFIDSKYPHAGLSLPMLDNVHTFAVQFSDQGESWYDNWDYSLKNKMPMYIQVELGWYEAGIEKSFLFEVRPPVLWN